MANAYLKLGSVSFETRISDYQSLSRSHKLRWAKIGRMGRNPAMQFMGVDADEITISGYVLPEQAGKLDLLNDLRALADTGEAQSLTAMWRAGEFLGKWAITGVQETQEKQAFRDGLPQRVTYSISLIYYGADDE